MAKNGNLDFKMQRTDLRMKKVHILHQNICNTKHNMVATNLNNEPTILTEKLCESQLWLVRKVLMLFLTEN